MKSERRCWRATKAPLRLYASVVLLPLTLSLLFAAHLPPAHAADVTVVGTPGVDGATLGADGGPGGAATATTPPNSDSNNTANAVGALDPNHTTAPQDMTKVQLPHHHGDFHFA
jgi:hypothetical protein